MLNWSLRGLWNICRSNTGCLRVLEHLVAMLVLFVPHLTKCGSSEILKGEGRLNLSRWSKDTNTGEDMIEESTKGK